MQWLVISGQWLETANGGQTLLARHVAGDSGRRRFGF